MGMIVYHSIFLTLGTYYRIHRYERGSMLIFECLLESDILLSPARSQGSLVLRTRYHKQGRGSNRLSIGISLIGFDRRKVDG
jgi:hypothetical protein